jgi:hypothetical protein
VPRGQLRLASPNIDQGKLEMAYNANLNGFPTDFPVRHNNEVFP